MLDVLPGVDCTYLNLQTLWRKGRITSIPRFSRTAVQCCGHGVSVPGTELGPRISTDFAKEGIDNDLRMTWVERGRRHCEVVVVSDSGFGSARALML